MVTQKDYLEWAKFRWKWWVIENFLVLPIIVIFILLHAWVWAIVFTVYSFIDAIFFVRHMRKIMRKAGMEAF
jgi:hypothetical protein